MGFDYDILKLILFTGVLVVFYFLPSFIASARKHHNANAIFWTNFLLGWTALGWLATFIWALVNPSPNTSTVPSSPKDPTTQKECPYCAETIQKAAKLCRYCSRELPQS